MNTGISDNPRRSSTEYRKLRAPQTSGVALIGPPLSESARLFDENHSQASRGLGEVLGMPLQHLAEVARQHMVTAAIEYTRSYRDVTVGDIGDRARRLVLAGHQPNLFHTGVWFKNFALHRIARDNDAVGINLLIDNDVANAPFVSVPAGTVEDPRIASVPYDQPGRAIPFERRPILDVETFDSFGDRVADCIRPLVEHPLIKELWPYAIDARRRTDNLGECLAQSRHRMEADWGLKTLEVPLSTICDSPHFLRFVGHIVHNIEGFREHYNRAVWEYRQIHGLRSHSHPAPLLRKEKGWFETPFWVWTDAHPVRRPLFVRPDGRWLKLRAGDSSQGDLQQGEWTLLASGDDAFAESMFDGFSENRHRESRWKLRSRALMTTMYARLFLSDLFLHGIGGSKYDLVTDVIIERFFGVSAPAHYTVTATMHLPLQRPHVDTDDIRQINGMLRELWFHPEKVGPANGCFSPETETFLSLTKEKKRMLSDLPPRGQRRKWHAELQQINTQIRTLVATCRKDLLDERNRLLSQLRKDGLLSSREYAFCLFPSTSLKRTLLDLCCVKT